MLQKQTCVSDDTVSVNCAKCHYFFSPRGMAESNSERDSNVLNCTEYNGQAQWLRYDLHNNICGSNFLKV